MGLKDATIILDNQYNTYYAGQTVNGRIEYVFDTPKKVRGIHVRFKGEAHTEWTESKEETTTQGKSETTNQYLTGNEEYFSIQYYLLGSNSGNELEIPAGKQVYTFTCALPPVLPSSFEGKYGYVRYTIKVTLDRPWKFDQETKMAFTVINALDLNLNPSYREPIHMQMEKTFCCLCCASAPLSVDVRAPVSGYCPGQAIPLTIDVENRSNVHLHLVKVLLRKVVTYRATSPTSATRKENEIVHTIQEGPVPEGAVKHWTLELEIPPIPPSNLVNCSIIDLDYDLKVECVTPGIHFNLSDKKYVTIGTVPLVGTGPAAAPRSPSQPAVLAAQPLHPAQPAQPAQPPQGAGEGGPGWVAPSAPPYAALYPSLSEPEYKAGPYAPSTIQDRGDNNYTQLVGGSFTPYYPTYASVQPPPLPQ